MLYCYVNKINILLFRKIFKFLFLPIVFGSSTDHGFCFVKNGVCYSSCYSSSLVSLSLLCPISSGLCRKQNVLVFLPIVYGPCTAYGFSLVFCSPWIALTWPLYSFSFRIFWAFHCFLLYKLFLSYELLSIL